MRTINAKVATVLSATEIALNVGADQGVQVDDKVRLYRLVRVIDPDSKEDLGGVQLTKLNLKVHHVQARLCTAIVTDTEPSDVASIFDVTKARRLKEIATQSSRNRPNAVLVGVGEPAVIESRQAPEDELF